VWAMMWMVVVQHAGIWIDSSHHGDALHPDSFTRRCGPAGYHHEGGLALLLLASSTATATEMLMTTVPHRESE